jgi:hypothetical protein
MQETPTSEQATTVAGEGTATATAATAGVTSEGSSEAGSEDDDDTCGPQNRYFFGRKTPLPAARARFRSILGGFQNVKCVKS